MVPSNPAGTDQSIVRALTAANELLRDVATALETNPNLDPDTVRHTLALLRLDPLARLNRSLLRGRAVAADRP